MSYKTYTQDELEQWLDQKCGASPTFGVVFKEAISKMQEALLADKQATAGIHIDPETSLVVLQVKSKDEVKTLFSWGPESSPQGPEHF